MTRKFTFTILAMLFAILGSGAEAWGQTRDNLTLTFALTSNPGGWPTTNSTTLTNYTYTLNGTDYTFALKNVKCNSGYLMLTSTAVLGLPAIENYKLTKVVAKNSGGCSTTTKVGISSSSSSASYISGGEIQTWSTTSSSYTYNLTGTEANTMYYMYVTNKNAQVVELTLTYESTSASTVTAPTFDPEAGTYYEDKSVELTAEDGCAIYYTLDGSTPDNESTLYEDAILLTVPSTTTIKAIAVDGENNSSNVASATYTLKRSQFTPAQLLAEVEPDNQQYIVVFNNETITEFYIYNSQKRGFYINAGDEDFLTYCSNTPDDWEVGGKVSGTVTGTWKTYSNLKEFCPANYDDFSYTPPTQQLPEPTGLTVSDLSMTGATLSWDAVEHASSYTVHVTDLDAYENTIEDIETTSVVLDDLTAGTEYMWTVQAIGDGVTYLNSEIAEGEVFETPTTVLYTVNFEPQQTGGTIEIDPIQAAVEEEVMAIAIAADHYSFTQWNFDPEVEFSEGDITEEEIIFIMPESDVTVTATFTEEAKYTVTYAKGGDDVEGGDPETFSYYEGDKVSLAENPYTRIGFTFNGWEVKDDEENDVTVDEGVFEMPASNVTVTATWAEKAQYTVTYMSLGAQIGTEQVYDGDLCANVPEVTNTPTGWTFFGWTTGSADNTTTAPEPFDLTTPIISATTLNAVFTKTEGTGIGAWEETPLENITSSDVFVITGTNANGTYSMSNDNGTSNAPTATSVTIVNGQITNEIAVSQKWNISGNATDGYVFYPDGITAKWLYCTNSNNGVRVGTGDAKNMTITDGYLTCTETNETRYIGIYSGADWRCYTSKTGNSNIKDQTFAYYKLNTGTTYYTTVAPASEYAITIDESIEHGTVEVEGEITAAIAGTEITLIVTPEEHYSLAANSLTVTGASSATVEVTPIPDEVVKYTFVMPAEAVTVYATFAEDAKYTVSFNVNGIETTSEPNYAGEPVVFPENPSAESYTFRGWTATAINGTQDEAPGYVENATYPENNNAVFYAVFAKKEGEDKYVKITSEPADWCGKYLIVYEAGNVAFDGSLATLDGVSNTKAVTISNNTIASSAEMDAITFTVAYKTGRSNIYSLKSASGKYISGTKTTSVAANGLVQADTDADYEISFNGTTIESKSKDQQMELKYNKSAGQTRFRFYKSGQESVALYKKQEATYSNYCTTTAPIVISGNIAWNNDVTISGNTVTIGSDAVLTVNGALINTDPEKLVIEDGGQLILNEKNTGVMATVKKQIEASNTHTGEPVDKWYTIGSPVKEPIINGSTDNYVADIIPDGGMSALTYNLYYLDMTAGTWINYRQKGDTPGFTTLENGRGYIYSNQSATTVKYVGELNTANVNRSVNTGWNLVSNPFAQTIAFSNFKLDNSTSMVGYYSLDGAGGWQAEPITTDVASNTGILVNVPEDASSIEISKPAKAIEKNGAKRGDSNDNAYAYIEINVANANYSDRAYAAFAEGYGLPKYDHINAEIQKVYIPQDGEDFAIAMMDENVTLFPVSFKAMTTGYYTISLKSSQIYEGYNDFDYLHLVDNMTGEETNMLLEDSYTFIGSPRDNENRFTVKLKISNSQDEDEHFAYQNGSELVINGEGTLQIFDVLGRVVISEEVHGQTVNVGGLNTGAYIVRLTGESVKTQKIIVR